METTDPDDARAVLEEMQKTIDTTFGRRPDVSQASPTELLEHKAELVKALKARRDAIAAEKKNVVERYDAAIARHTERITALEREITESRRAIEAAERPKRGDRAERGDDRPDRRC